MGFTINELIEAILNSALNKTEKVDLLAKIYRTGQLSRDMCITKLDGDETLVFVYFEKDECGRRKMVQTNFDAKQVIDMYLKTVPRETTKRGKH